MVGSCTLTALLSVESQTDGCCSPPPRARLCLTPRSGGGLSDVQKQVLEIMENGTENEPGELTPPAVRRQLLALEKAIDENRRLRTKFPTDPTKCVLHVLYNSH